METMHGQPSARLLVASSVLSSLLFMTIGHITLLLVRTSGQTGRDRPKGSALTAISQKDN